MGRRAPDGTACRLARDGAPRAPGPSTRSTTEPQEPFEVTGSDLKHEARKGGVVDALGQRYDAQFRAVFEAIRDLMAPPASGEKRRIGFRPAPSVRAGLRSGHRAT